MTAFLVHLLVTAILILAVARIVPGIQVDEWTTAIVAALVLGLVNAIVRPILILLTLPLTIVTFGLFLFVINALMLELASWLVPGFKVAGFGAALVGSLVLTLLNVLVANLLVPIR